MQGRSPPGQSGKGRGTSPQSKNPAWRGRTGNQGPKTERAERWPPSTPGWGSPPPVNATTTEREARGGSRGEKRPRKTGNAPIRPGWGAGPGEAAGGRPGPRPPQGGRSGQQGPHTTACWGAGRIARGAPASGHGCPPVTGGGTRGRPAAATGSGRAARVPPVRGGGPRGASRLPVTPGFRYCVPLLDIRTLFSHAPG